MFNLVALILGVLVERGKRQQARMLMVERSAALDLAATAVSHEMNDLLDALKSISSQMVRAGLTEINRSFQYEIGRLEEMVDIISTFSSKEPLHLFSHDLNEIIQERVRRSVNAANKADVRLEMALDNRGCPCRVDFESLGRVIDRIIQNALEVSFKGQSVHIRSQRNKNHCEIEITDQGHGIQPEHLLKVFKPFFTTKDKRDGLSLSVSQKVVQNMGGKISVQSDYGHGATFLITIPLAKSENFLKKRFEPPSAVH
jgi:signal transduction histidine kinase